MSKNTSTNLNYKICFFFPYHVVSGVPVLFSRIANAIVKINSNVEVYIIDYVDGVMSKNVTKSKNIHLIPFEDGISIIPPQDAILILQSILPYSIRPELKISTKTKLVFWTLHPDNLVPNFVPIVSISKFLNKNFSLYKWITRNIFSKFILKQKKFIELCYKKNSLWFMDYTNLQNTNKYLFTSINNPIYLPVPSDSIPNIQIRSHLLKKNYIEFCWIGRLCDFKIHILVYTLIKLNKISQDLKIKINFNVIGDGDEKWRLYNLKLNCNYFSLNLLDTLNPNELDIFLQNKVDAVIAMGTSALEAAKFGIPTILVDYSYYPIKFDYKFRWLFNTQNFDLGHEITNDDYEINNKTLFDCINQLTNNYMQLSESTYYYQEKNHNLEEITNNFLEKIKLVELTYNDIPKENLNKRLIRRIHEFIKGYRKLKIPKNE